MKQSTNQHHYQGSSRHYNNQRIPYNINGNNSPSNGIPTGPPVVAPVPLQPVIPSPQQPHANTYHRNNSNHQFLPTDMPPVETVVARLETACSLLHGIGMNNTKVNEISSEILILSEDLRRVGPHLELSYPDVLDRVMSSMRDASAQPCLPPHLRLAIFELVELRASKWLLPSDSSNYYRQRRTGQDDEEGSEHSHGSNSKSTTSGGTGPLDKADSKTYREEILIKNSDSGKVMGVRGRRVHIIEAMSDTIISFEKVGASAKERVLSINGYSQQSINMAKALIHDTINRNASPVFDESASATLLDKGSPLPSNRGGAGEADVADADASSNGIEANGGSSCQFNYTVAVRDEVIKVSGNNFQLVQEAKLALDDYFACKYNLYPDLALEEIESNAKENSATLVSETNMQPQSNEDSKSQASKSERKRYSRDELIAIAQKADSKVRPDFAGLDQTIKEAIVRKPINGKKRNQSNGSDKSNASQSPPGVSGKKSS